MSKKFSDSFSHLDTIPACDRQMDGQTSYDCRLHYAACCTGNKRNAFIKNQKCIKICSK